MSGFENWPASILRRWLLSAAAGPVIFLIGLAGRIALHDPTLLTLSTLLASCMVVRCILLFQAIRHGDYETVEGVCVTIRRAPLGGHQRIRLMDDSGTAHDDPAGSASKISDWQQLPRLSSKPSRGRVAGSEDTPWRAAWAGGAWSVPG